MGGEAKELRLVELLLFVERCDCSETNPETLCNDKLRSG
jgi:hypothetical protein